ncbi:rod shape-determining protein MreD [Psychrobium sp. 1_MG-2023]|uniref:rod shape-determining protein MreD n=1 Tax=Psychrobium sp. 1_MG-2023 TaxID=3062624 RepID=UPI000C31E03B|nr:rod shape-determining protein MreD [Psychrobium sp. 1_MG-2023]MDP2560719.1 rod shape-determining protein MreD [Psychrobium sp. 1_MG-2023]PKF56611.1 rod shape-determining protein MreD [Alteromonadales bacterium alter-6D02]
MRSGSMGSLVVIWSSVFCAAFLQVMPLPPFLDDFRPNWLLLISFYWCVALPHRFNIGSAWLAGLVLDLLWGANLGVNALSFVLVCATLTHNFQRVRSFSVWQQAIIMALLSLVYQFVNYLLTSWFVGAVSHGGYYLSVITSLIVWPWIFFMLRKTRRHWSVT